MNRPPRTTVRGTSVKPAWPSMLTEAERLSTFEASAQCVNRPRVLVLKTNSQNVAGNSSGSRSIK